MRRWSWRRKAYSGVRSSCPNGILLTLVTSGAKYRSGRNIHRAASDSQDRMCCSTDRRMDIVPAQMLLLDRGAFPGSVAQRCCPRGNPAAGHPGLWIHPRGETWGWSGHRSPAGAPMTVVLHRFISGEVLIPGVIVKAVRNIYTLDILPWPSSIAIPHPSVPPSLLPSYTFLCAI